MCMATERALIFQETSKRTKQVITIELKNYHSDHAT
jgi:hypothetical protein